MKSKKKIIVLVVFLVLIAGYIISPLSRIREVSIVNTGEFNENFDTKLLELQDQNFWFFNTKRLSNDLMRTGLIDEVKIDKAFYCKLNVSIKWKNAVISMKTNANKFAVLDKTGYVISLKDEPMEGANIDGLIVKYARIGEPIVTENNSLATNAVNLHFMFSENHSIFSGGGLSPNIKIRDGEIINSISEKFEINFGDGSDYEEKFSKAVSIYNDLHSKEVVTGIINVSHKNHYVYETWK